MTDSYAAGSDNARVVAAWRPARDRRLIWSWSGHWPLLVMTSAVILTWWVRGDQVSPAVLGAILALSGPYLVAVRWGCWRWLAGIAVIPVALSPVVDPDVWGVLALASAGAAVVVGRWRASVGPAAWIACAVLLALAVLASWEAAPMDHHPFVGRAAFMTMAAVCVVVATTGVVGVGRAEDRELRLTCLLLLMAPMALGPAPGYPSLILYGCWPMAAAVAVTAVLRGSRGAGVTRPQADEVDQLVVADFAARCPETLAPVVIVIAAYNEADGLPDVMESLPTEVCGLTTDVIVVDDGSSDGTAESLAGTRAYVARCPVNRGQGAALRLGYRLAREHGARYIITTDADGQYDVADMPTVLQPILEGVADFVTGSRILGRQETLDNVRRVGVHVFAWLATILTGQRLTDTSFGLRAMRAEVTGAVTLNQPQYQSSELLLSAISDGFRVMEVPATMHLRSAGTSKKGRNLVYGTRYAKVMTTTWWREGALRPVAEWAPAYRVQATTSADGQVHHTRSRVTGSTQRS